MPRDTQGNYSLVPGINPVVPGTVIEADWANPTMQDIAIAMSDSLSRSGSGGMLSPFKFADGVVGAPGSSWVNEPTSGWYRAAINDFWYSVGGTNIFRITKDGIELAPGKEALNISAFINVQDDEPADLSVGEQWYESDTGGLYMRYRNPDNSETLISISSAGGDFIPYAQRGQPNGVATLDGVGKVPLAQIPTIGSGSLPINVPNGIAGLDADAQLLMAQIPGGEPLGVATLDVSGHVPLSQLSGLAVLDANGKVSISQLPVGLANGVASLDGTIHVPSAQLPIGVPGGLATLDANGDVPVAQLPVGVANGIAGLDASAKVPLSQLPDMPLPAEALTEIEAAALYIPLTQRAAANGIATLDSGSKVPVAQLPSISIGLLPAELLTEAEAAALYIPLTQRGVASGVATLDATTKVPNAQLHRGEANGIASLDATGIVPTSQLPPFPPVGVPGGLATLDGSGFVPDAQVSPLITRDTELTAAMAAHEAAVDPHTGYQKESEKGQNNGYPSLDASGFIPIGQIPTSLLSEAEALALYVPLTQRGVANGVASLDAGGTVPDAQLPAGLARDTEVTAAIAAHVALTDPHPTYLTVAEGNAAYEALGAVATHAGLPDPHPGYLTAAEGNAAYEAAGAVAAHAAAADPHAGYQKESEKGVINGYASLDNNAKLTLTQLPDPLSANLLRIGDPATDDATKVIVRGTVQAVRIGASAIEGVDPTGSVSYQPMTVGGSLVHLSALGIPRWDVVGGGHLAAVVDNSYDIGASGSNRPRNVYVAGEVLVGDIGPLGTGGYRGFRASGSTGGFIDFLQGTSRVGSIYSSSSFMYIDSVAGKPIQLMSQGSPGIQAVVGMGPLSINHLVFHGSPNSGTAAVIGVDGADANINLALISKGPNGSVRLFTGGAFDPATKVATAANEQVRVNHVPATSDILVLSGGSASQPAAIRLPHGPAHPAPANGDVWTTTAGLFSRINGATVGPYGVGGGGVSEETATMLSIALG